MARSYQEIATTPAVQEAQRHYYGRAQTFRTSGKGERTPLGPDEIDFIGLRDSFYIAMVSETGWPYVQHRGGPIGFLRVRDKQTLAFDDYPGNRQLLSTGNVAGGDGRAALFLMDYPHRTRLKIMGQARVLDADDDPALTEELLTDARLRPKVERVFIIDVLSYDWNCPQYITPRYTEQEIEAAIVSPLRTRIRQLEAELGAVAEPLPE